MTKDVADAGKATTNATTRATSADATVKVLQAEVLKHKNLFRLTTDLSTANAHIAELERDVKTARTNPTTAGKSARETSTAVFDIQGAVTDLTRILNDKVRNAFAVAHVRVDGSQNPHQRGSAI